MSVQWRNNSGVLTRKRYLLVRDGSESVVPENDELKERVAREASQHEQHETRERHAEARIARFQKGMTGAGISLSQPSKPSDPQYGKNSASLSERRDTQEER